MVAYVLADALLEKLGGDSLEEMRPRFEALRKANLNDLNLAGGQIVFWPKEERDDHFLYGPSGSGKSTVGKPSAAD
jgi:hypothetical protein